MLLMLLHGPIATNILNVFRGAGGAQNGAVNHGWKGSRNFAVLKEWNKAPVYRCTITRLAGGGCDLFLLP
jgi:hypothetical protein